MACVPSEDLYQPGHPPSLIRVFAVRMKKVWILSYPLSEWQRLCSDWTDAQTNRSLRWAHMHFCWFCHVLAHFYSTVMFSVPSTFSDGIPAQECICKTLRICKLLWVEYIIQTYRIFPKYSVSLTILILKFDQAH